MRALRSTTALLLILGIVAPSALLVAPHRAHAQFGGPVTVIADTSMTSLLDLAKNSLTSAYTWLTSGSVAQLVIKEYTLDPIVRALAQAALQSLVGSVINFVNGKGAGGTPLFAQNLQKVLLQIGDKSAFNFFGEILKSSNSPYAAVLTSTLQKQYLQSTTASGFWAANQCTLSQASPNILAFIGGDFKQGGFPAWFSLTTQAQNNPYTEYYALQAEQQARVATLQGQEVTRLNWGQGLFSWCGSNPSSGVQPVTVTPGVTPPSSSATPQPVVVTPKVTAPPLDNCLQSDGNPGITQTPGSVIHDELSKSLGSGIDSLVSAHEIDEMIGALFSSLITSVLGGNGLAGASQSSGSSASIAQQLQTPPASSSSSGTSGAISAILAQVNIFSTAWQAIKASAQAASTNVNALAASCSASAADAQTALTTEITPVLNQASTALTTAQQTTTFAQKVSAESASGATTYTTDLQTLAGMPPTANDVTFAQTNSQISNGAAATASTSLIVSGGTLVDQMNLISTNAMAAKAVCTGP